jgi:Ala-tRNA(Pro) deacylase
MDSFLADYLKKHSISYIEHKHPAFFTVKESEKYISNLKFMHTKSLFLRDEHSRFYLVCLPAHDRLNIPALKKHLEIKELEFATPDELSARLHVTPGSVSIFSLLASPDITLILDNKIWQAGSAGFHPNINTSTLELSRDSLAAFYNSLPNKKEIIALE